MDSVRANPRRVASNLSAQVLDQLLSEHYAVGFELKPEARVDFSTLQQKHREESLESDANGGDCSLKSTLTPEEFHPEASSKKQYDALKNIQMVVKPHDYQEKAPSILVEAIQDQAHLESGELPTRQPQFQQPRR